MRHKQTHKNTNKSFATTALLCATIIAMVLLISSCAPALNFDGELAKITTIEKVTNCRHLARYAYELESDSDDERNNMAIQIRNLAGKIGANRIVLRKKKEGAEQEAWLYICQL